MTNTETILEVRRAGFKPRAVHVHLVDQVDPGMWPMNFHGSITCEIAAHEQISDIDFRFLHGLYVLTFDFSGESF